MDNASVQLAIAPYTYIHMDTSYAAFIKWYLSMHGWTPFPPCYSPKTIRRRQGRCERTHGIQYPPIHATTKRNKSYTTRTWFLLIYNCRSPFLASHSFDSIAKLYHSLVQKQRLLE